MDNRLIIQTIVEPNCKLVAVDNSNYDLGDDIKYFVFVDFLSYNEDKVPIDKTIKIHHEQISR